MDLYVIDLVIRREMESNSGPRSVLHFECSADSDYHAKHMADELAKFFNMELFALTKKGEYGIRL